MSINTLSIATSIYFYKKSEYYSEESVKFYQKYIKADVEVNSLKNQVSDLTQQVENLKIALERNSWWFQSNNEKLNTISNKVQSLTNSEVFYSYVCTVFEIFVIVGCSILVTYAVNASISLAIETISNNQKEITNLIHNNIQDLSTANKENAEILIKNTNDCTNHVLNKMNTVTDISRETLMAQNSHAENAKQTLYDVGSSVINHIQTLRQNMTIINDSINSNTNTDSTIEAVSWTISESPKYTLMPIETTTEYTFSTITKSQADILLGKTVEIVANNSETLEIAMETTRIISEI